MTVVFVVLALAAGLFIGWRLGWHLCPHCAIYRARDKALAEMAEVERLTIAQQIIAEVRSEQYSGKHAAPKE
jgi:hypothetical protein